MLPPARRLPSGAARRPKPRRRDRAVERRSPATGAAFHAQPSLNFHGRCDETLEFYEQAIGGKTGNLGLAADKFGVGRMVLVAD
jgi:hypothetical protein